MAMLCGCHKVQQMVDIYMFDLFSVDLFSWIYMLSKINILRIFQHLSKRRSLYMWKNIILKYKEYWILKYKEFSLSVFYKGY
jgi:hypothetical protein